MSMRESRIQRSSVRCVCIYFFLAKYDLFTTERKRNEWHFLRISAAHRDILRVSFMKAHKKITNLLKQQKHLKWIDEEEDEDEE